MKDNGKIILALLAGASAGVVAGILMAPEAGETTRGNLKDSASKLGKGLGDKLQAGMGQLSGLGASAGALIGGMRGAGDARVNTAGNNSLPADLRPEPDFTTASSHLDNNPTGGNLDAIGATSSSMGNTGGTNDAPASSGKKSKGSTGGAGKKATDTTASKGKSATSKGGSSKGSGGGSNPSA